MKSTPSRPGTPSRVPPGGRSTPPNRAATAAANRKANARAIQDYARGMVQELRRVTWPTQEEWVAATILTIALVVGVGFFTYAVDVVLGWVFSFLTGGAR